MQPGSRAGTTAAASAPLDDFDGAMRCTSTVAPSGTTCALLAREVSLGLPSIEMRVDSVTSDQLRLGGRGCVQLVVEVQGSSIAAYAGA